MGFVLPVPFRSEAKGAAVQEKKLTLVERYGIETVAESARFLSDDDKVTGVQGNKELSEMSLEESWYTWSSDVEENKGQVRDALASSCEPVLGLEGRNMAYKAHEGKEVYYSESNNVLVVVEEKQRNLSVTVSKHIENEPRFYSSHKQDVSQFQCQSSPSIGGANGLTEHLSDLLVNRSTLVKDGAIGSAVERDKVLQSRVERSKQRAMEIRSRVIGEKIDRGEDIH